MFRRFPMFRWRFPKTPPERPSPGPCGGYRKSVKAPGHATIDRVRALLNQTAETAARYLENLDHRGVAPTPEALLKLTELDEPLPEHPLEPDSVLEMLDRVGSPATMGMAGRRYFGFVIGGSLPAALAANWLAGAWDQCPGLYAASPIGTVLEEISLNWLLDALKLPAGSGGAFVTGATVAN